MQLSEFANPAQVVGQGANVAGDERMPDGVRWRVSLGREFLLPRAPWCCIAARSRSGSSTAVMPR